MDNTIGIIKIKKSATADTRTSDHSTVTKEQLIESSKQHIQDVARAMGMFTGMMLVAVEHHDYDKLTNIDSFHKDFVTGFKSTTWWERHIVMSRHHLTQEIGVPSDVNLIDVLEMIADCVMAGMGRTGNVYPIEIDPKILTQAVTNTFNLLKSKVVVVD